MIVMKSWAAGTALVWGFRRNRFLGFTSLWANRWGNRRGNRRGNRAVEALPDPDPV